MSGQLKCQPQTSAKSLKMTQAPPRRTKKEQILRVLFVCTGNICRSPTAERLAAAYAVEMGIKSLITSSAGTKAVVAHPMHTDAAIVLKDLGGDPTGFTARQLTPKVAVDADLILAMSQRHRDRVLELCPQKLNKTFLLHEASQLVTQHGAERIADLAELRPELDPIGRRNVADPIGLSFEVFQSIGLEIAELLPPIMSLFLYS